MSLENEDDTSVMEAFELVNESEKKPRVSYTRDFLLSLSELEICKKLPSGFDQSILREFEENSIQDRPRAHGNSALQGFRRNDYSSSPPTRGDSSNFSRGGYGRWDNRSTGWSDKDGDSQSDTHPDSGRSNYGNQSRRPWQNSEHDGLLGSGSFPRPSGFAGGTSAPKGSTNEHHHLNRSNEAYQPPRPFKAGPPSRPNTHDSFNDETFGSIESTSQDRAEERKRRASFELMRKEQQKVLQEKQKMNANKVKGDEFTDLVLEEVKEEVVSEASGELKTAVQSVTKDDSGKSSVLVQSSKPRPLVPPGFKSTILEKSSTTKPVSSIEKEQNPKPGIEEIHLLAKGNYTQNGTLDNQMNTPADHHLHRNSGFSDAVDGEVFELVTNNKIISNSSQESSTSLLGKFFGSGPTIKDAGPTGFLEKSKPDDPFSQLNVQSSKFAQWFNEDEKKAVDDLSSSRPNDLLSLIGGGDKAISQVPNIISVDPVAPELPYKGFGITETHSSSKHLFNNFRQESAVAPPPVAPPPVAAVLTCEDLEQTIMSEYSVKSSNSQPPGWSVSSQENADAIPVNNHATHHLLSLLQKGTAVDEGPNTNIRPVEAHPSSEKPKDGHGNNQEAATAGAGQNLSLEALFGTAFMKELQSAQAPVSAQRAPQPHESSASNVDGMGPTMTNYESNKQPVKSDEPENWLNFDGQRVGVDSSRKQVIGTGEIQLPEEESLIIGGDPANTRNPNIGKMLPAEVAFDISEKLAILNSGNRIVRGPYDMLEPERQFNNHTRRPMFHPLDPNPNPNPQHLNSQMRFPEHLMQRDAHLNQQFPGSMPVPFHHPDARVTGFDIPVNVHPQMLPQMRMQGNIPPPHMLRDLQRPHASNVMPDHGFPFPNQQTNIGGLGLPLSVADGSSGSNHPEALQRMMEMERWAQQSKQVRPVNTGHNQQGVYGHGPELDMGFRYR
ncbi:uncharacterized protein LOC110926212 isoform X3 [Helianthus annuus]|uniref:uncharacterized protein LOC110926212 isoform X3 n=1 Tax=Helianthus annuus TaxID=4232 RepID=UPI000B909ECC|nr:uncharacterized protein LOC110926212 isoform X3 [Helianthus annuus]